MSDLKIEVNAQLFSFVVVVVLFSFRIATLQGNSSKIFFLLQYKDKEAMEQTAGDRNVFEFFF